METLTYKDRHGSSSVKWDILDKKYGNAGLLAMWIADVDFEVPECISEALKKYVDSGIYGYYLQPQNVHQSFIDWQMQRYGCEIKKEWIRFSAGGAVAVYEVIEALTKPGDGILTFTPAYMAFTAAPAETGRELITVPLHNEAGYYTIDYAGLEEVLKEKSPKMLIFCSPHNPVCRAWKKNEIEKMLELCRKYNVIVLCDEVHQDTCHPGYEFIPICTFKDYYDLIVCVTSPAKTFNIAGCRIANIIIPDDSLRKEMDGFLENIGRPKMTSFSMIAYEAAYKGGAEWVGRLMEQVRKNAEYVFENLKAADERIVISPLEATYLMWLDFSAVMPADEVSRFMKEECNLALNSGTEFGGKAYEGCVRMNIATSFENVKTAVDSITGALKKRAGR